MMQTVTAAMLAAGRKVYDRAMEEWDYYNSMWPSDEEVSKMLGELFLTMFAASKKAK